MGFRYKLMMMEPGLERDKLAKEYGFNTIQVHTEYPNKIPKKFKDEINNTVRIPKSPYREDWGKCEKIITQEHELYFKKKGILFWHTKVKGEIQATSKGNFVMKNATNPGFFDMILLFKGSIFVGLELKHGDGGEWRTDQIFQHRLVTNYGGHALVSNSVKITEAYLKSKGLV